MDVERLDNIELNCLAKEKDIERIDLNITLFTCLCFHQNVWHVFATWCRLTVGNR